MRVHRLQRCGCGCSGCSGGLPLQEPDLLLHQALPRANPFPFIDLEGVGGRRGRGSFRGRARSHSRAEMAREGGSAVALTVCVFALSLSLPRSIQCAFLRVASISAAGARARRLASSLSPDMSVCTSVCRAERGSRLHSISQYWQNTRSILHSSVFSVQRRCGHPCRTRTQPNRVLLRGPRAPEA